MPDEAAITRLVGALVLEQHHEWAIQRARHMTFESIAHTGDNAAESLPNSTGCPPSGPDRRTCRAGASCTGPRDVTWAAPARHERFRINWKAICRESVLARLCKPSGGIVWPFGPSADAPRPPPASVADADWRVEGLFRSIGSWAESTRVQLSVDDIAAHSTAALSLSAEVMSTIFFELSPRALQPREPARPLVDFLAAEHPAPPDRANDDRPVRGDPHRPAIAPPLGTSGTAAPSHFIRSSVDFMR